MVPTGCVGARWFQHTTRMPMAVVVKEAWRVCAGGAWGLLGCSLCKGARSGM